jgi:hypothetical protein
MLPEERRETLNYIVSTLAMARATEKAQPNQRFELTAEEGRTASGL